MGMLIAIVVIFAVLVLLTSALGLVRAQRLGVAGVETTSERDVSPAALGAAMGVVALVLIVILYLGITQWQWLGRPDASGGAPASVTPAPVVSAQPVVGASPPAGQTAPSPSPSK